MLFADESGRTQTRSCEYPDKNLHGTVVRLANTPKRGQEAREVEVAERLRYFCGGRVTLKGRLGGLHGCVGPVVAFRVITGPVFGSEK